MVVCDYFAIDVAIHLCTRVLIQFRAVRQMYVYFLSIYGRYATRINTIQFNIDLINFYNVVGWTYEYESSAQKYLQSNKKV